MLKWTLEPNFLLGTILPALPGFVPPPANFDWDDRGTPVGVGVASTSGESKKKGRKKTGKKYVENIFVYNQS